MQFKADYTKEGLLDHPDPLFETHFPLRKLKTVATLLASCKPDDGLNSIC